MGQSENEQKKEYLQGYRKHLRRIRRIRAELIELREIRTSMSTNNNGMPHASSGPNDLSVFAAELDQLERDLRWELQARYDSFKEILHQVKLLCSENEKDVLFYRYIKGLDWWEIAGRMGYSERHITRLHGKALAHFQLPGKQKSCEKAKDVLECPIDM